MPAPSVSDPSPLNPATTPGGLKPSPWTLKARSNGPLAKADPATLLVSASSLPPLTSARIASSAPLPRGARLPAAASSPPKRRPFSAVMSSPSLPTEAASVAASTFTAEPSESVLASSAISPSTSPSSPSEKPRDGQRSEVLAPIVPNSSSVEGVRCHATSTPSSDGSDTFPACPFNENRVLAPLRSSSTDPVTSSPAMLPAMPLRPIVPPCLVTSRRRLKGTPDALGGDSRPISASAALASLLTPAPLHASDRPAGRSAPSPTQARPL